MKKKRFDLYVLMDWLAMILLVQMVAAGFIAAAGIIWLVLR